MGERNNHHSTNLRTDLYHIGGTYDLVCCMTMNFTKFTQLPKKDPEHTFRVRVSGDHTKQLLEKVITVPPATDEQQLDALIRQAFEDCLKQLVKGIR